MKRPRRTSQPHSARRFWHTHRHCGKPVLTCAGKTTFTRALLRAAGFAGRVKSPTFELVTDYDFTDGITLHHFDFYRFEDPQEFDDAGFRDLFGAGNVCVSEWSEKAEPLLPAADLVIELTPETPLSRTAKMTATTELGRRVLKKVQVTP